MEGCCVCRWGAGRHCRGGRREEALLGARGGQHARGEAAGRAAWRPRGHGDETGRGSDGRRPVGILGLARSGAAGNVGHAAGELFSAAAGERGGKRESRVRNRGLT